MALGYIKEYEFVFIIIKIVITSLFLTLSLKQMLSHYFWVSHEFKNQGACISWVTTEAENQKWSKKEEKVERVQSQGYSDFEREYFWYLDIFFLLKPFQADELVSTCLKENALKINPTTIKPQKEKKHGVNYS